MAQKKDRPSVEKFKAFVKQHPKLRQEVRNGNYTWQELYEEWNLFGGDHEQWEAYRTDAVKAVNEDEPQSNSLSKTDFLALLLQSLKTLDIAQVQQYISSANQALGAIQGIISSFQGEKPKQAEQELEQQQKPKSNPFVFRKD